MNHFGIEVNILSKYKEIRREKCKLQMHHLSQIKSYHGTSVSVLEAVIAYLLRTARTTTLLVEKNLVSSQNYYLKFLLWILFTKAFLKMWHLALHLINSIQAIGSLTHFPVWGQAGYKHHVRQGWSPQVIRSTLAQDDQQTHCDNVVWTETSFEHKPELFWSTSAHEPASHA